MAVRLLHRSFRSTVHLRTAIILLACLGAAAGCGSTPDPTAPGEGSTGDGEQGDEEEVPSLQSSDILQREPVANRVEVRHILIGWSDLGPAYGGNIDPRAGSRTRDEAETLTKGLYQRIQDGESFEALMAEHSEDTGSARTGVPIEVTPDAGLVLDFKRLSLRLEVGEIGIVLSRYGWHIIKRTS